MSTGTNERCSREEAVLEANVHVPSLEMLSSQQPELQQETGSLSPDELVPGLEEGRVCLRGLGRQQEAIRDQGHTSSLFILRVLMLLCLPPAEHTEGLGGPAKPPEQGPGGGWAGHREGKAGHCSWKLHRVLQSP